jgi:hypothetical protein
MLIPDGLSYFFCYFYYGFEEFSGDFSGGGGGLSIGVFGVEQNL